MTVSNPATLHGLTAVRSVTVYRSHRDGVVIDGLLRNTANSGTGSGRSLVSKVGNLKRADISIAKFSLGSREVGGAHSTSYCSDNITLHRKGALL